jgi:serine/threonine protein kinase
MEMPAQLISHYRILDSLGSGGMGVVYRAEDTTLHRTVALKFISEQSPKNLKVNERLRHEARTASALNHPNICTIYEVGEDAGEVFIAKEYVEGRTLAEAIRQGPLPIDTILRFARQLASALAHAHDRGVLHGDLKPLNIIVTPQGDAKILDFGLARRSDPAEFDRRTLETVSFENRVGLGGNCKFNLPFSERRAFENSSLLSKLAPFSPFSRFPPCFRENSSKLNLLAPFSLLPPRSASGYIFATSIAARCGLVAKGHH